MLQGLYIDVVHTVWPHTEVFWHPWGFLPLHIRMSIEGGLTSIYSYRSVHRTYPWEFFGFPQHIVFGIFGKLPNIPDCYYHKYHLLDLCMYVSLSNPLNEGHISRNASGYFYSLYQTLATYQFIHKTYCITRQWNGHISWFIQKTLPYWLLTVKLMVWVAGHTQKHPGKYHLSDWLYCSRDWC